MAHSVLKLSIIRTLLALLGRLPFRFRSWLGARLGAFISLFPTRDKKVAQEQLKNCLPEVNAEKVIRQMYASVGATSLESLNLRSAVKDPRVVECDQWEPINGWLSHNRCIVALTGHVANWELLGAFMSHHGISISTIGKPARDSELQEVLAEIREGYGVKTIWRSDRMAARQIVDTLKNRGIIAALIDQDTQVDSIFVPFFGKPASTPSALIALARRFEAIIVSIFLVRTAPGRYKVVIEEIDSALSDAEILTIFNERLEQVIRQYPEQWVWFHKRWRTLPNGERLSTREYISKLKAQAI